jgi:endoglucanase
MKNRTISIVCLMVLLTATVRAQTIRTPNGFQVRTGVNLALWLSQSEKRGPEREQFIMESDVENIASMGFDHVRLPVDEVQLWDEHETRHEEAFRLLHNAIKWSLDRNLRIIVDLHIIRSHYFNAASNPLWTDPAEQEKLVRLWQQLSGELFGYPNDYVAYELLNEAVADEDEEWNLLIAKLVRSLREKEPERTIVIGSNRWQGTETFPALEVPPNDENIILSFHHYRPFGLTHYKAPWTQMSGYNGPVHYPGEVISKEDQDKLSPDFLNNISWAIGYWNKQRMFEDINVAITAARELGLPLYCGEFSVYYTAPREDAIRWYRDVTGIFRENNIAFCHWEYKDGFPVVDEDLKPLRPLVDILTE